MLCTQVGLKTNLYFFYESRSKNICILIKLLHIATLFNAFFIFAAFDVSP